MTDLFTFVVGEYRQLQLSTRQVVQLSPGRLQLSDVITPARIQHQQLRFQLQKQDFLLTQSHVHIAADTEKVFQTNILSRWAKTIGLPAIGFNEAHIVFATAPNLNRSTKLCRTVMRHKESPRENMGWNLLCGTVAPPVHHTAALRPVTFPLPVRP